MPAPVSPARSNRGLNVLLGFFAPAPPAEVILQDPAAVKSQYRYWQRRILVATIIGYALFYFVRKNLSVAMPEMAKDLGISKTDLGLFLTLHGLLYGVSKFANGFLGDRSNARRFMAVGLILSAIVNVFFGFSSAVLTLGVLWMLNGWVQGMGFPPCARLMTHWFPPHRLATNFAIWNTSHSIGAALVVILCGYLAVYNWRLCFFVPAALAALGSIYLWTFLRDTPPSVGLPEVEGTTHTKNEESQFSSALLKNVFSNKYIWFLCFANFFVYTVRYAILDWGPTLLTELKDVKLQSAGWMVAAFEVSGIVGMLVSGWITDRLFGGRGARVCVIFMALTAIFVFLFWKTPTHSLWISSLLLCACGFFIYGPQALVGTITANLATKRLAATAIGFTGVFAYASTLVSGWGLGTLVHHYGWDAGLSGLSGAALIGTALFALAWPAKAHSYEEEKPKPVGGAQVEVLAQTERHRG
jgi:phosphoglycerate transporter family protein